MIVSERVEQRLSHLHRAQIAVERRREPLIERLLQSSVAPIWPAFTFKRAHQRDARTRLPRGLVPIEQRQAIIADGIKQSLTHFIGAHLLQRRLREHDAPEATRAPSAHCARRCIHSDRGACFDLGPEHRFDIAERNRRGEQHLRAASGAGDIGDDGI